jgi:hypothetical protein
MAHNDSLARTKRERSVVADPVPLCLDERERPRR